METLDKKNLALDCSYKLDRDSVLRMFSSSMKLKVIGSLQAISPTTLGEVFSVGIFSISMPQAWACES